MSTLNDVQWLIPKLLVIDLSYSYKNALNEVNKYFKSDLRHLKHAFKITKFNIYKIPRCYNLYLVKFSDTENQDKKSSIILRLKLTE